MEIATHVDINKTVHIYLEKVSKYMCKLHINTEGRSNNPSMQTTLCDVCDLRDVLKSLNKTDYNVNAITD